MSDRSWGLSEAVQHYLRANSLREPEVMRKLREETAKLPDSAMQISPEQGQFMALLAELLGAQRALEVGMFTGYSALAVARVMPDSGRLVACELESKYAAIARPYWQEAGVDDRIEVRIGPAVDSLNALREEGLDGTFDLAFIDADKPSYLAYYEACLALVRVGGLILIDNVLWGGAVANPEKTDENTAAIREVNRVVHADERVSVSMIPIGDGLYLARKR